MNRVSTGELARINQAMAKAGADAAKKRREQEEQRKKYEEERQKAALEQSRIPNSGGSAWEQYRAAKAAGEVRNASEFIQKRDARNSAWNKIGADTLNDDMKALSNSIGAAYGDTLDTSKYYTQEQLNASSNQVKKIRNRLKALQDYYNTYGGSDEQKKAVGEQIKAYDSEIKFFGDLGAYYGQYKNEADFNYRTDKRRDEHYIVNDYDAEAGKKNLAELKGYLDRINTSSDSLSTGQLISNARSGKKAYNRTAINEAKQQYGLDGMTDDEVLNWLTQEYQLESFALNNVDRMRTAAGYRNLANNEDFLQGVISGKAVENPTFEDYLNYENAATQERAEAYKKRKASDPLIFAQDTRIPDAPSIVNKLKFYEDLTNDKYGNKTDSTTVWSSDLGAAKRDALGYHYGLMTDDEKRVYYYLLGTQGKEAADKYLEDMDVTLDYRNTEEVKQFIRDLKNSKIFGNVSAAALANTFGGLGGAALGYLIADSNEGVNKTAGDIAYSAASVPLNVLGGGISTIGEIGQRLDLASKGDWEGKGYNPYENYNLFSVAGREARGLVAKDIEDKIGWEMFGQNVMSQVYQSLMSGADSAFGMATLGRLYTISMGGSAAASKAAELYESGASSSQIYWESLLSGIAEATFEYLSIENLSSIKNIVESKPTTLKKAIKMILTQNGVEASEEVFTEIANMVIDKGIKKYDSDYDRKVTEYVRDGMTREEAVTKAAAEVAADIGWAGAGGFISGFASSSLTIAGAYRAGKANADAQISAIDPGNAEGLYNNAKKIDYSILNDASEALKKGDAKAAAEIISEGKDWYEYLKSYAKEKYGKNQASEISANIDASIDNLNQIKNLISSGDINADSIQAVLEKAKSAQDTKVDMTSANDEKLFSLLAKGEPSNSVIEKNILKDRGTLAAFERLTGLRIGGTTVSQKRADVREAFKAVSSSTETLKAAQNAIESGATATEGHKNAAVIIDRAIQANRAENSRLRNSEKVKSGETKAAIDATNRQHRFLETVRNYVINGGDLSGFTESPVADVSAEGGTNSSETKTTQEAMKKRVRADFSAYQNEKYSAKDASALANLNSKAEQDAFFRNENAGIEQEIKNIESSDSITAEEKAQRIGELKEAASRNNSLAKAMDDFREMGRLVRAGEVDKIVDSLRKPLKKMGVNIEVVDNVEAADGMKSGAYFDKSTNTIKVSRDWNGVENVVKLELAADGNGFILNPGKGVSFDRAVTQTIAHEIAHADSGLTLDFIKAVAGTQYDAFDLKGRLEHPDDRSWRSEDAQKEKNWRRYVDAYTEQAMLEMKGTEEQRHASAEKVVNDAYIFEEIMADMFGAAVDDMGHSSRAGENIFWAMNRNKPGIIKRILNALERFIARIRGKDAYLAVEQRQAAERLRDMLTGELKRAYGTDVKGEAAVESDGGKRYSLAGRYSQTADLNSLGGAYQMYQNGVSMDTIRKRTGWWLGKDGKWRYEISDKEMRFNPDGFTNNPQTVGDYVKHDRLFAAYPWIADIPVNVSDVVGGDPSSLGRYVPSENFIELKTGVPTEKTKHVLIHELQHAIQNKEHFTSGTNSTVTSRYIVNLAYNNVKNNPEFKAEKSPRGKMDYIIGYLEARMDANFDDIAKYYYSRNHGEIEAQYADKRLDMSDNARKAEPIVNYGDVYTREDVRADFIDNLKEIGYNEEQVNEILEKGIPYDNKHQNEQESLGQTGEGRKNLAGEAGRLPRQGTQRGERREVYRTGKVQVADSVKKTGQVDSLSDGTIFRRGRTDSETGRNGVREAQKRLNEVSKPEKRFSLARANDEYMKAVESGNVEEQQRLVDEAAENAGYDTVLYHGTQSFGFTQIDVSKYSDDGISFFATSNPEMAQTYSAKSGTREISRKSGIENLSLPQVVDRLNAVAAADTSDYDRYTYRIMNRSDTEALKKSIQSGIKELRAETERLISEYADRLAKDFNGEDELKHSRLRSLLNALDSDSAIKLSANLYTVLNHNEIFDDAAKVKFGNLEADIRLLKKLAALTTDEDVVVREDTDRYDIVVEDQEKARNRLEKLDNSGNYVLRGRTEGFLEIDGNGHNWNGIFTTLEPKGGNTLKAEYDFGSESLKLSDRDGEFAVIPAKSVADAVSPMARAFARRYGTTFATTVLAQTKDQLKNSATAEVKIKSTGKTNTRDIANFAREQGYPGVKITDIYDNGGRGSEAGRGDVYIFFNPEQDVKSADPITYDNDGNVIPLSERFNSKNNDIRYSLTRANNEYMKAVESGDTEEQRRLVDEAAKANGYDRLFWHGSKNGGGFTEFRDWSYFTENKKYASRYAKPGDNSSLYEVYANLGNTFDTRKPECREIFDKMRSEYGLSKVQESGLPDWTDGYDIAEFIDENGLDYDSIILDEGGDLVDGKPVSRGFSYVIRSSEQVKSADPITYDDSGNVIPLTERFDSGNRDIRWSISSIVGDSGKDYGTGVVLDSTLLDNLSPDERVDMVKEYVKELGGQSFTAFDKSGKAVSVRIAEAREKFRNQKGKKVPVNKHMTNYLWNQTKQEAIVLVDELITTAKQDSTEPAHHSHDWLDNNGLNDWDVWKTYIQDKEKNVWEASLQIANASNGDKVLYEVHPIKKVEGAKKISTTSTDNSVSHNIPVVNTQSMQDVEKDSSDERHSLVKSAQSETETIESEDKAIKNVLEKFSKERYYKSGYPYKFNEFLNRIADLSETSGERIPREQLLDTVKRLFRYAYENSLDGKALGRDYRHDTDILAAMVGDIENEIYDWVSPLRDEYNEARDAKKKLRMEKIFVPTEIRTSVAEAAGFETWSDFRKSLFGIVGLVNEQKGRALSEIYAELSEIYPEYFPDNITDGTEQAVLIADLARNMRVNGIGESNVLSYEEQLVKKSIGRAISELLYNGENTVSINAMRKRIAQLKEQREKAITSLKEKYAEQFKNRSEKQKQTVLRNKVLRKYTEASSMLDRPTTENHFTEAMRKPIMEFLAAVDITTGKSVAKQEVYDRILSVIKAANNATSEGGKNGLDIAETDLNVQEKQLIVDSGLLERMAAWVEANQGKKLTELSSAQLEELNGIFNQLKHLTAEIKRIYDPREGLAAKSWQAQKEIGLAQTKEREQVLGAKTEKAREKYEQIHFGALDAAGYYNTLGSDTMTAQFERFRQCQNRFSENIQMFTDRLGEIVDGAIPKDEHGKNAKEVTLKLSRGTLTATPAQLMSVYLMLNQEDSRRCLFNEAGGVVIGKFTAERPKDGKLHIEKKRTFAQSGSLVLNEADAAKITAALTDGQRKRADAISALLNNEAARLGNEVSMAMYGYKKYTTENYFPMRTIKDYEAIATDPNHEMNLLGLSFTKERTGRAGKALVAEDIYDVIGRHLTNMAQYNAFAQELDNAKKMYSLQLGDGTSLKQRIIRSYGREADAFYNKLINNLSGVQMYTNNSAEALSDKLLSNYKAAAVAGNVSVVLKQPMSIFRALPEFSLAGLKKSMAFEDILNLSPKQLKANTAEMLKYSGIARLKAWGSSENMTRKSFESLYNDNSDTARQKINEFLTSGAENADMWTWAKLWRMSKAEIDAQGKYTAGSKEYFEAVDRKFSDVIGKTQVVQSALDSSMAVQNAKGFGKFLFAFQNEPLKQYSYLISTLNDARRGKPGAKKKLAKVIASSLANTAAVSAISTFMAWLRGTLDRDDDDELLDDLMNEFAGNAKDDILSGAFAPVWQYIDTIMGAIRAGVYGNTVERLDMAALTDLGGLINKYFISQNGGRPNLGTVQDIVNVASNLFGLPAKNIFRDVKSVIDRIILELPVPSAAKYNYLKAWKDVELTNKAAVTEAYYDVLRDAVDRGRYSDYVKIKRDMIYHGYTETKIKNAVMKSSLMDDLYELKKVNPGSYKAKVNSIVSSVSAVSSLEGKEFEDFIESAMKRREREDGGSKTDDEVYNEMHRKMEKEVKEQLIYIDVSKRAAYIKKMLKTYGEYGITEADILKVLRKAGKA